MQEKLHYRDSDGALRTVDTCTVTQDKAGRYWLWCDQLKVNLAGKMKSREDMLLSAIDALLFYLKLRDQRINALQRIADLAEAFADQIKPDEEKFED